VDQNNENEIDHVDNDDDANDDHNNDDDEIDAEGDEEHCEDDEQWDNVNDVELPGLDHDNDGIEREVDDRYGARTDRYDLRPRKQRDYSHLFATKGDEQDDDDLEDKRILISVHSETPGVCDEIVPANATSLATSQMSMKRGIKVFGIDGVDAVRS
jgi:hypothetical protein